MDQKAADLICPQCGEKVESQVIHCQRCGVNLDLAAVISAEQTLHSPEFITLSTPPDGQPLTPEILVPRLGEILLEKEMIPPAGLERALGVHQELAAKGRPRLLGQILLELGLVDRETLDQVITEQILKLQAALQASNRRLEQRVQERTADLQTALGKLSELNQLKSNFISNISHELRTPLTHMKGYLDLLSDGSLGALLPDQKDALEVLSRAEARLAGLIEDLIRFSLAVRGEFTLRPAPADLGGLIKAAAPRARMQAGARGVTLAFNLDEDLPAVPLDYEKITWVILQLLDNAIKFTPRGGAVTLSAQVAERGILISVVDTGIGILPERIQEIFEPFHQLDGSMARRYAGTGLGLALVSRILEAHGSLIKVQSEVGNGSRFEFVLPVGRGSYV